MLFKVGDLVRCTYNYYQGECIIMVAYPPLRYALNTHLRHPVYRVKFLKPMKNWYLSNDYLDVAEEYLEWVEEIDIEEVL